jgi:Pyruvate/2-oxoacid:ferredoxin oxidoreductase delta subunit
MAFLRAFNDGRLKHVGKRVVVIGGGDTSIDVATVAKRLGHIEKNNPTDHPEHVIAGQLAHDVASVSAQKGAEVVLISRATQDKMNANKHEIEQALKEGVEIRGGVTPVEVIKGADGRATGLKVAELVEEKGRKVVKPGSEYVIEGDLIVAAIGQAVDFTGLEVFNNGKGLVSTDKNYQIPNQKGVFAGGDIIKPHLLTTAIGHASIAAESIDALLSGEELGRRPKVDVHHFDLLRNQMALGKTYQEAHEAIRGTDSSNVGLHNYEFSADRIIIPHDQLFLGHFPFTPRNKREVTHLDDKAVLGHFQELLNPLDEKATVAEAKRCMSCGLCFECDNCIIFCPQAAVKKVPKKDSTIGRYVITDYAKCVGCHICKDVCPTGYIQMGLGE